MSCLFHHLLFVGLCSRTLGFRDHFYTISALSRFITSFTLVSPMVLWQLCTLHHLHTSGFGRPFPRHGLQLLFWFSNHCVTFDLDVLKVSGERHRLPMKPDREMFHGSFRFSQMVSECEPENGAYGFHRFGNLEELLPVLPKPKKKRSTREVCLTFCSSF